jgi:hypothetical protein
MLQVRSSTPTFGVDRASGVASRDWSDQVYSGYSQPMRRALPLLHTMDLDSGEYTAFLTELQHAAQFLTARGISNERMALAIVDSLAERLLYQHAERCFSAGDARVGILTDPFPATRRTKILGDFRKRVQLALTDEEFFVFINPLLDEFDAEIFRLAHDYRGPSYHRGEHNRALAGPLGRLYAQAVGRAFIRAMSNSFSTFSPDSVAELERFRTAEGGPLSPSFATGPIVEVITDPLTVDRRELAMQLRADSERRIKAVEDAIEGLRRDLDDDRIGELIEGAQHWAEHRGDEELHRLAREEQILENEASDWDELGQELAQQIVENKLAQIERMKELSSKTDVRVDLDTIGALRQRIGRLAGKVEIASLLHSYEQVDDLLGLLETTVEWTADSWERWVEQAVDEARGK